MNVPKLNKLLTGKKYGDFLQSMAPNGIAFISISRIEYLILKM